MNAPDGETPIDRAFNATDLPHGEYGAFKAGWEAARRVALDAARRYYHGKPPIPEQPLEFFEARFSPAALTEHPGGDTQ